MSDITTTVQTGSIKRLGTYIHGDINWIDHGGALLVTCNEDPDNMWLEVVVPLQSYDSSMDPIWEIYRIPLFHQFDWVDLPAVASCCGLDLDELKNGLQDPDPRKRTGYICAIGEYYGFGELDPDQLNLDPREVRERYPDEDPIFECKHDPDLTTVTTRIDPDEFVIMFECKTCGSKGEF